jgi:hypothetical protein
VCRCFLCAYTAGEALGALETSYDDDADCLTVRRRCSGDVLLRAPLASGHAADRQAVESFFSSLPSSGCSITTTGAAHRSTHGRSRVRLVESAVGAHHFGNTSVGFKSAKRPDGDASGGVVHIVNAETVRALSVAAGFEDSVASAFCNTDRVEETAGHGKRRGDGPLAPSRFRPNIVLKGLPAWREFDWVGKYVRIGGITLHVVSRTVRCEATNVDARAGSGRAVVNVPQLLQEHFPVHGPYLGVYARVVEGGSLRVGDAVADVVSPPPTQSSSWLKLLRSMAVSSFQRRAGFMALLIGTVSVAFVVLRTWLKQSVAENVAATETAACREGDCTRCRPLHSKQRQ